MKRHPAKNSIKGKSGIAGWNDEFLIKVPGAAAVGLGFVYRVAQADTGSRAPWVTRFIMQEQANADQI